MWKTSYFYQKKKKRKRTSYASTAQIIPGPESNLILIEPQTVVQHNLAVEDLKSWCELKTTSCDRTLLVQTRVSCCLASDHCVTETTILVLDPFIFGAKGIWASVVHQVP